MERPSCGWLSRARLDRRRWFELCARLGCSACDERFATLEAAYAEQHRRYHTTLHVRECLALLDLVRDWAEHPDEVELAIWLHDVVYVPWRHDNERRSAEWFAECARGVLATSMIDDVVRMIMATEHRKPPAEFDEKLVVDIDLSSFGLPWPEFLRDGKAVRAEASHLDDATFNRNHVMFMRSLLDRERIYSTDFFHDRYERSARYNMARKIRLMAELPSAAC